MIWLSWRQHRREALLCGAAFALLAVYLVVTGRNMYAAYGQMTGGLSVALCEQRQGAPQSDLCNALTSAFFDSYGHDLIALAALVLL
ncbi:MAG TPA: hypothetical protein VIC27_07350, partial [Ktedonobacterales bacterium]